MPHTYTTADRSADAPPELPAHVLEKDGEAAAYFEDERTAALVAVLLNARETAPQTRPTRSRNRRPSRSAGARGAWAGNDRPQPGRVYSLSGLAGGGVAEDVTEEHRATEPRQEDDEGPTTWDGPAEGCTVTAWPSGLAYVRFERKPDAYTLDALRAAGARWMGRRKGWRVLAENLPEGFDRAPAPAAAEQPDA